MTRKETEMKGKEDRKKDREVGREERRGKGVGGGSHNIGNIFPRMR